ncbi:MAG: undecaprenyl-diphosphate phosphatase [Acholeplasmataceae bacterium]|nr:undecaprenyl-diphosphate phosphatase [Acholeplasmataceae bacterium]
MKNIWEIVKYAIIGLIQGITEPLPISSSGHMIIADEIFGQLLPANTMNNFQIIVNFASLIAIIIYYRHLLKELIIGSWKYVFKKEKAEKDKFQYVLMIIIASVPAAIVGLIVKLLDLDNYYTNIVCVAICLFITGLLLLYIHHQAAGATRETITWKDSVFMGVGQSIGLLPGISRSGITTSFGIANKVSITAAFRFSFMMYIPASIGATAIGIWDIAKESSFEGNPLGYAFAFFASLVGTYFAIKFFFKLIRNKNLKYFGFYCLLVSLIVAVLIITGVF